MSIRDYFAISTSIDHRNLIDAAFEEMLQGVWGQKGICRSPVIQK